MYANVCALWTYEDTLGFVQATLTDFVELLSQMLLYGAKHAWLL
jgi:hypothetical protein